MKSDNPWVYPLVTILAVSIAYFFNRSLAGRTQRTKDLRERINAIGSELDEIEDLALSYYLMDAKDAKAFETSTKIKTKLKRLGHAIGLIHKSENGIKTTHDRSLLTRLVLFRTSVTGDDFESIDRVAIKSDSRRFSEISSASVAIKAALERIYEDR